MEVPVKYFPIFKYNLEGFYIKLLARNPAATDYCVSHKLIFHLYWLYVNVLRVVFLQMDLPKFLSLTFDLLRRVGQWQHLRIKFDPLNVLLALLEFYSKCSSLESLMKIYESGNDMASKITWVVLKIVQRDVTQSSLFIILLVHSTCFGCQPHLSSGVHETVTTASGTAHIFCAATSIQRGLAWPRWREVATTSYFKVIFWKP